MPILQQTTDDVILTSSFTPVRDGLSNKWRPPAGGASTVTAKRKFTFTLPSDAQPRTEDADKGGIWAHVVVGNITKSSLPYGWKVASVSPRNAYITAQTKSLDVTFTFQSDTKPGEWSSADRHTKYATIAFERISLIIYYTTNTSNDNNYRGTRKPPTADDPATYTEYRSNIDATFDESAFRSCITVHDSNSTQYVTNGLAILQPSKCIVTEQAGGSWQLEMVHPISDDGRWKLLEVDRLIRAPVPVRQNPQMAIKAKRTGITVHEIYKSTTTASLREKPNTKLTTKIIRKLLKDEQVQVLEVGSWCKVVTSCGESGYVAHNLLEFVRQQETEASQADGQEFNSVVTAQQTRNQVFRIYSVQNDAIKRQVTVKARHISYDFASNMITGELKATNVLLSTFLGRITENLAVTDERTLDTDITNKYVTGKWEYVNPLQILLEPDNGVIKQLQCQLVRDNHSIYLLDNTPADRGYTISYAKNLKALSWSYNAEEIVTRIMPTGQTKKGEVLKLPETYVDSTHINDYPVVRCSRLDVSAAVIGSEYKDEKTGEVIDKSLTEAECFTLMREAAQKQFDNGCDLPKLEVEVDFTALETTHEYADLAGMYQLYLYDTVHIKHEPLGYEADAQVYETQFDCIAGRYNKIKLGDIFKQNEQTVAGYQLSEGSVSGTKIAASTITGTNLADASITNAKIGFAAISAANISDINADTIKSGTLTTDRLVVTGSASIAGQLNTASKSALDTHTESGNNIIKYVANDAVAVTDEGVVIKSHGKLQIVSEAEFTVDSTNLDIDENGTLTCSNAVISGAINSNGFPVVTEEKLLISSSEPTNPVDGMVWIQPTGGATAVTFSTTTQSRDLFNGYLTYTLNGAGASYSGTATYNMTATVYRGYASDNTYYLRATVSDGTKTVDLGSYKFQKSTGVGNITVNLSAQGDWVMSGNSVELKVWMSSVSGGSSTLSFTSVGIASGSTLKVMASGAGSSAQTLDIACSSGTKIGNVEGKRLSVNIASGKVYKFTLVDQSGIVQSNYSLYEHHTDGTQLTRNGNAPNTQMTYTATQEVDYFGVYTLQSVTANGTVTLKCVYGQASTGWQNGIVKYYQA